MHIAVLILDREGDKSNAFPSPFEQVFLNALYQLNGQEELKVLILTSAKKNVFSLGADVNEFPTFTETDARNLSRMGHHIGLLMEHMNFPIIAAINGLCLGGGLELALACDYRICSTKARFGQPEIQLGLIPGWGGCLRLPRVVGKSRAMRLILTGEFIPPETAVQFGLVDEVVPPQELMPRAMQLAEKIASRSKNAIRQAKHIINLSHQLSLSLGALVESEAFAQTFSHQDSIQAVRDFLNRQKAPTVVSE